MNKNPADPKKLCLVECVKQVIRAIQPKTNVDTYDLLRCMGGELSGRSDLTIGVQVDSQKIRESIFHFTGRTAQVVYTRANTFEEWDFDSKVADTLRIDGYVICTLSAGKLYKHTRVDLGHAVVIETLSQDGKVGIFDPGPEVRGMKTIKSEDLYWASRAREGGLIQITID